MSHLKEKEKEKKKKKTMRCQMSYKAIYIDLLLLLASKYAFMRVLRGSSIFLGDG